MRPSSFIWDALTVIAIAFVVRWLLTMRGSQQPQRRGDVSVYSIKLQLRLACLLAVAVLLTGLFAYRREFFGQPDWFGLFLIGGFVLFGLYFVVGSVQTDERGIRTNLLFLTRSLNWNEITEVRVNKRPGGSIDLLSRTRRLTIDFRFVAQDHLLNEIARRTGLRPIVRGAQTEPTL